MPIDKKDVALYLDPLYFEDKGVKEKFHQWYGASKIVQIRAITLLTAFLYIIYAQIDNAAAPSAVKSVMTILHLYVLPCSLFLIAGLTFFGGLYRPMIFLLSVAPVGAVVGNLFIITRLDDFTIYLPELYLIIIWVFAISGLRLMYAAVSASVIIFIVLASSHAFAFPLNFLFMHFLWMVSAFSFGVLSAFVIEKSNKLNFLNERNLESLATTDRLTGISNRMKIENNVDEEVERARRYDRGLSIIMLDVDYFKQVNDEYGHHVGDVVLREIAAVVQDGIRKVDSVGRWGGEEFIIVLPETSLHEAKQVAEQIRLKIENHEFTVVQHKTGSFGVAAYIQGDNSQSIINRADKALYKAKELGRNQVQGL
ncbi:GGDEF domain-containing protein [Pseudomonadota bacterium]